ncbi:hypothetical protein OS493_004896 [Desmophyllum pertusum]|uniref:Ig-like domain-containing protein n=1 Tax=Desmophyllum pertusum TaxID=174260 RepID=A0A9W9Z689_9CNID|nr:hypothetical protein OS493_004896 [Desmophyllum pertusum]
MYCLVKTLQPVVAVFCLAILQATVFAATNATERRTFELGSGNVTLFCGNRNLSSSTVLTWSKGAIVLMNITSHNSTLVLFNLTAETSGLYICRANSSRILRRVQLTVGTNDTGIGREEQELPEDEGLVKADYIAIAIGLGLTTFIVVSMAVLLYRAEKRRKHMEYMNRWRITVKGHENMAVIEEDNMTKPVSRNDFYLRNGHKAAHKTERNKPAEYHWLETLGRKVDETDGNANNIRASMWRATAYV